MTSAKVGAAKYRSRSAAAAWYLKYTHLRGREIARKVGVSDVCVSLLKKNLGLR